MRSWSRLTMRRNRSASIWYSNSLQQAVDGEHEAVGPFRAQLARVEHGARRLDRRLHERRRKLVLPENRLERRLLWNDRLNRLSLDRQDDVGARTRRRGRVALTLAASGPRAVAASATSAAEWMSLACLRSIATPGSVAYPAEPASPPSAFGDGNLDDFTEFHGPAVERRRLISPLFRRDEKLRVVDGVQSQADRRRNHAALLVDCYVEDASLPGLIEICIGTRGTSCRIGVAGMTPASSDVKTFCRSGYGRCRRGWRRLFPPGLGLRIRRRRRGRRAEVDEARHQHAQIAQPAAHVRIINQAQELAELLLGAGIVLPVERSFRGSIAGARDVGQLPLAHFGERGADAGRRLGFGRLIHGIRGDDDCDGGFCLGAASEGQKAERSGTARSSGG